MQLSLSIRTLTVLCLSLMQLIVGHDYCQASILCSPQTVAKNYSLKKNLKYVNNCVSLLLYYLLIFSNIQTITNIILTFYSSNLNNWRNLKQNHSTCINK